jgi:hypothetical protein
MTYLIKGTSFGMMLCCIGRRVRARVGLTKAAKALAPRDHVRDISGPSALSNSIKRIEAFVADTQASGMREPTLAWELEDVPLETQ